MSSFQDTLKTLRSFPQKHQFYYSLPALEEQKIAHISRLPVCIRIILESLLRNCNGKQVKEEDVLRLAKWSPKGPYTGEVPFIVARVLLQDFTGVPLVVDLAAMRDAVKKLGFDPSVIEPLVPVDLVVDHSVQVDRYGTDDAYDINLKLEFQRNRERYEFLKWGEHAFKTFKVVPPGIGICHQANLEHIASVVMEKKIGEETLLYFDTLVGTDSHTPMVNGLGVLGWGVGGIEAEAAMLGQPVAMQMPEVIGVHCTGHLKEGVTATDLALRITELLRKEGVVDKLVEFYGEGVENLSVADRATIANMAPEYGATCGYFPLDDKTIEYLRMTGRSEAKVAEIREYLKAQKLFGIPKKGETEYTRTVDLDLKTVVPSVSGPKRPQDRIHLPDLKKKFEELFFAPIASNGYERKPNERNQRATIHPEHGSSKTPPEEAGGTEKASPNMGWSEAEMVSNRPFTSSPGHPDTSTDGSIGHGSVVIAAITSCTNTSNPFVMLGAGLVAKKAVEKGLKVHPAVKTSLAPGSRVVTEYLHKSGLQKYLDKLGFQLVGYGCTTCIGNSGPLDERIEKAIKQYDLIAASVLSGNRNFEARIHSSVKANFLMSPMLVVAFALAGRVDIDLEKEPIQKDKNGQNVFLRDLWPSSQEIEKVVSESVKPEMFKERYANILHDNPIWGKIIVAKGSRYEWDPKSTYIQLPPYFEGMTLDIPKKKSFDGMRCLAILGDSVTTDHISPAGAFKEDSPAGKFLLENGVKKEDFNSYGSRRGNHLVMMRGTFANVRIKNKMADGKEGGFTKLMPDGKIMTIFDATQVYAERKVPLIIFAGKDYGMGSSRDWAAKGTALLGVRAVVAQSFERIHRSNLIGMGVLPLEFQKGQSHESLHLKGEETFSVKGLEGQMTPNQTATLEIDRGGHVEKIPVTVRINTPIEAEYFRNGGIMQYVLRHLVEDH